MFAGDATATGTARFRGRFPLLAEAGHFRRAEHVPGVADLWLSSIGLGTYLGNPDAVTDARYTEAVRTALVSGINVLDTAINYRHQRSERSIGAALAGAINAGEIQRDEVLVCTKAGFLTFDGEQPASPQAARAYFNQEYLSRGVMQTGDVAGGMHCMAPSYLGDQIERSRRNLQLETIDVFYLHNPETQLAELSRKDFLDRMESAFAYLENAVSAGKIRFYGTATWNGYRVPRDTRDYLSLAEVAATAENVGGKDHHFRFVQLPFNLGMLEAFALPNQPVGTRTVSLLEAARQLGIAVMGSATILQGQLARSLPPFISEALGFEQAHENSIQFARSAPGMLTSLVGMSRREHVLANVEVAQLPPTADANWRSLLQHAK